ncbi:MAG: hypothetical protein JJ902_10330 [Roseibium sp.]|nr:hypothetical protein [Roseibium sp.]
MTFVPAAILILTLLTGAALAVYPEDEEHSPPVPTPTSSDCPDGKAWDAGLERCIDLKAGSFTDNDRYRAARELAYADRFTAADLALDAMVNQLDPRLLTYRGFLARKRGDWPAAEGFYQAALQADPDNLLARSYLGMGLIVNGNLTRAFLELKEIQARGGRGTWPEQALLEAIRSGGSTAY